MKITELHEGDKVKDRWFKEWGIGTILKVLKTQVHISWSDGKRRDFDKQHTQFLEKV
jgi:hypothetical protein